LTALFFVAGDLKEANKMTLNQSQYCIRYTSEIIASSNLSLIREQDSHQRDIDSANKNIEDIVSRYNTLVERYNKNTRGYDFQPLNPYSYKIVRTVP
jgi:hypothetical protein